MSDGYFTRRGRAFKCAWQGVVHLFRKEEHARIHLLAAACVILFAIIFQCSATEWCLLLLCIGGVLMGEGFNTAIEALSDKVCRERHPLIKVAKDVAAGAVLIFAAITVAVGLIIFIPKFIG